MEPINEIIDFMILNFIDTNIISAIIGALIGGAFVMKSVRETFKREKTRQESFAAAILYNDLRSIESYLKHESSPVNLRYSENWQQIVSYCSFLTTNEIEFIYTIYDEVYNFNYLYKLKENDGRVIKKDIKSYGRLRNEMFNLSKGDMDINKNSVKYQRLKENLKKHMK